ncbi:MAG: hypothetical protein KF870_13240 [Leadbetterella sp.]|nr:hypothetical protein [Leadbetterella sp.]
MAQKKGQTGNPNGRPKGSPNKITMELRGWVAQLIDDNREQLEADLKMLDPKDRWAVIEKLMQYTIPKVQSTEMKIDLNDLTEAQLDELINRMMNGQERESTATTKVELW